MLNLFEHPIAADLDGAPGVEVLKGGLTLNGLVNLGIAVGQNLPYSHVLQAWDSADGERAARVPAGRRGLPAALQPGGRRRRRRGRARGGGRDRPVPAAGDLRLGCRAARLPEVHRRLALRRARHRRRGRRREARHRGRHARGPRVLVADRPAGLRRQRRVVDLAPRRALHRRPRDRHPPARHRARSRGRLQGRQGPAELDAARRRLAVRHSGPLRDPRRGRRASWRAARAAARPAYAVTSATATRSPTQTRPATGDFPCSSRPRADCSANQPRIASRWQDAAWRASSACSGSTRSSPPPTATSGRRSTTPSGSSPRSRWA